MLSKLIQLAKQNYLLIVCGIIVIIFMGLFINKISAHYSDKKFEKIVSDLKQKADAAESRAQSAESEKLKYQIAIEVAGRDAEMALKKVENAKTKFQNDVSNIDNPVDICERYNRVRASLGLRPTICEESSR